MTWTPVFYSVSETSKPPRNRVRRKQQCMSSRRDIPQKERRPDTGGSRLCDDGDRLNKQGR